MIADIVVDTNVFMHASNPTQPLQKSSLEFVKTLLLNNTQICVDEGFDIDESKNRSAIGAEYKKHILPGTVGFQTIIALAKYGRVKSVKKGVPQNIVKRVNQNVFDKTDRVFVKVAYNSACKTLLSHDSVAIPDRTRKILEKEIDVVILRADEV